MPKYGNVRIANFFFSKGKGKCFIAQGNKTKNFSCVGVMSRATKVESVAVTPSSGGIIFDPPVTCEINKSTKKFLICKKGGK